MTAQASASTPAPVLEINPKIGRVATALGGKLSIIKLADIEVTARYREDYGDLNDLALSLNTMGQLQNLVVVDQTATGNEKPYRLLAGGRRYKTMTEKLGWEECRALVFPTELTTLQMLEIEWEENCRRKDLDWKEDCAIKAEIQKLKLEQFGQRTGDMISGTSLRETASELGISPATMSEDVKLARAVEVIPDLFKNCKTKKEAKRVMKLAADQMYRAEAAKKHLESIGLEGRLRSVIDRYIVKDFFEGVKEITDVSVDFIEIDPPYVAVPSGLKGRQNIHHIPNNNNEIPIDDYLAFIARTLKECQRIMKEHSYGILWHMPEPWGPTIYELLTSCGFETTRTTGKWLKPVGHTAQPSKLLANACEEFFYFWKGTPTLAYQGHTNIFDQMVVPSTRKYHPNERPIALMKEILSIFCWENSRICIPFLGSGVTILAAELLKMKAFGFELSSDYKDGFILAAKEHIKD